MINLAELRNEDATLEAGRVVAVEAERTVVAMRGQRADARRAAACLIEPEAGDRVLVAVVGAESFIVTVLERAASGPLRLEADDGLEIRARRGRVAIEAGRELELSAATDARLSARTLEISALTGNVLVERMRFLGERVEGTVAKVRLAAETIDVTAERLKQQLSRCYRFVKEMDQLRAGVIDQRAERFARLHAEDTIVTADKLVKVDGEQIHIG